MLDLPSLLASTAATIRAARALPVAPSLPPTVEQINAVLEQLPVAARRTLTDDPDATVVHLLVPLTRETEPTARAVVALLSVDGVEARIEGGALVVAVASLLAAGAESNTTLEAFCVQWRLEEGAEATAVRDSDRLSVRDGAGALYILAPGWERSPVADLLQEAQPTLTAFRAAWLALAGPTATAAPNPSASTLLASVGPHTATLAPGWRSRPVDDLIEEARVALFLPRWSLAALEAAWSARCSGGSVVLVSGTYPLGGGYRAIPAVAFSGPAGGPVYLDQDDVRELTVAAVMERAALAASLGAAEPTPPAAPPEPPRPARRSLAHRSTVST